MRIAAGTLGAVAATMLATLAFGGAASAKLGESPYAKVFPYPSSLCTSIAAGKSRHKRLEAYAAQVKTACTTLEEAFNKAHESYESEEHNINTTITNDRAAIKSACVGTEKHVVRRETAQCRVTRRDELTTIASLHRQLQAAGHLYQTNIVNARHAFWDTIKTLPEGASLQG